MNRKNNKILIIDDVSDNVKVLVEILKNEYKINVALNGVKGIELARSWGPDLILLDVMMPEMDGYEVCKILKSTEETKHIPVILLTALSNIKDEYLGISLGAIDYITKPVHPKLIRARIRNYIKLKEYSDNLERLVNEKIKEIEQFNSSFIDTLALIAETRDSDLGCHIERCKEYAKVMLNYMVKMDKYKDVLNYENTYAIIKAVALHDIGKIGIPDNILLKNGKLTDEEFEVMKGHSYYGYKILKNAEDKFGGKENKLLACAKEIAYYHHEQWDGNGYPLGLKQEDIPLPARIMMVIDVFDAIVSKRVYKGAKDPQVAVNFIQEFSGKRFDPQLVKVFLEVKDEFFIIAHKYADEEI
ncbi:HD-GYP domain-containing protein [uncultured Clostridium sp.]|uniref:HD-GYP domain-containing protein n=1 Tax=uncultured Clostridium sp. TaxID=59620 RepID=UPI00258C47F3|nr:HD domain-containing phosphohydrolase [uncultured Clostridium sp.]